jgi:phosphoglycerol transferase MdoB-like AlkP superfamily enzyme
LDKAGYTTVAMHGDSKNFWNRSAMYPSLGFQTFHGVEAYTEKEKGLSWGVSDRDFLLQSAAKLPELKQPYYAHMITLSSHTPYIIPEKYRQLDVANLRISDMQKNYLQAAHYTDSALGEFVADLKTRGLWDNTVLVLMGDHEAFMTKQDDADFANFLGYKGGFTDLSYLQARQVPFIIHAPGLPAQQLSIPGSQLDVYPTLTNLLGLKTPPTVLGKDLLNTTDPLVARRRRTAGIDLEMVLSSQLNYVGNKNSSSFSDGRCYRGQTLTKLEQCRPIYDRAHDKVELSDLIVTGNALNLLK